MNDNEIKHLIKLNYKLSNGIAKKTKRSNIYKNATKTLEAENETIWTMIDTKTREIEKLIEEKEKDKEHTNKWEEEIDGLKM